MKSLLALCFALALSLACSPPPTIPTAAGDMSERPDIAKLTCPAPTLDCTADPGCETKGDVDPLHCGGCDQACPVDAHGNTSCVKSLCQLECITPWAACGPGPLTHCSTYLATDSANCGGCGHVCAAGTSCKAGSCT